MVGEIISGVTGVVGGITNIIAAQQQKEQAEAEAKKKIAKRAIDPAFYQKKNMDLMASLSGLPAYGQAQNALDAQTANQMRTIEEYSPNGAATVAAISAALGQQDKATNDLSMKNAEYKAGKMNDVGNDLLTIGEQNNRAYDQQQAKILQQATNVSAMRNAAMANQQTGINSILGSVGSTASSLQAGADKKEAIANGTYNPSAVNTTPRFAELKGKLSAGTATQQEIAEFLALVK